MNASTIFVGAAVFFSVLSIIIAVFGKGFFERFD
jgi:hypothetical protein